MTVAMVGGAANSLYYTEDGFDWVNVALPVDYYYAPNIRGIAYASDLGNGDGRWMVAMYASSSIYTMYYSDDNGDTWTEGNIVGTTGIRIPLDLHYANGVAIVQENAK